MFDRLRDHPPRRMVLQCAIGVTLVAALDWFTGPDLQVIVLYLVPVVGAAWYVGGRTGAGFAVATTVVTLTIAHLTPGGHSTPVAVANAGLRLVLLLLVLQVIGSERRHVDAIRDRADLDPLTRAMNRRAFTALVEPRLTVRDAFPGTMLYLDVDGLKRLNDAEGHEQGDRHLVALAEIIRSSIRSDDHFARLGGDEFAVFLTGQDIPRAHAIAARLLDACARRDAGPIRLSIGVAGARSDEIGPLLRRAHDAMYEAKRDGGGVRVERMETQLPSEPV